MKRPIALALVLAAVFSARAASSQVIHRTQSGETLGGLAQRYYGDPGLADLIAHHNGIKGSLKPGVELRLPSASRHEVASGESWNDLAARYWGDAAAGQSLARWCGADAATAPAEGQVLTVPALVRHRIEPGETLVALSRRYYRNPEKAPDLARLNRVANPKRLHAGAVVRLPFFGSVRPEYAVQAAPKARVATTAAKKQPAAPPARRERKDVAAGPARRNGELGAELGGAVNAYLDGNFEDALARLEAQRTSVLASGSKEQRGLLLRYLVFSYVAFDRNDAACDAYSALQRSGADAELDPELVSPKIRGALGQCGTP
jgi:LysM repeat protein